jgi:hypothetical protein
MVTSLACSGDIRKDGCPVSVVVGLRGTDGAPHPPSKSMIAKADSATQNLELPKPDEPEPNK